MGIEQPVQCLGSLGQFHQISLSQSGGERIEEAPDVSLLEFLMGRFSPFVQDIGDCSIGHYAHIGGANDQIMRCGIIDFGFLVGINPFILIVPEGDELPNCASNDLGQIASDEPGVFSREFNLTTETEVVTHEYLGTRHDASGEAFVMRIA
jgi:hypothetical protein